MSGSLEITIVKRDGKETKEIRKLKKAFRATSNGKIWIAIGGDGTFMKAAHRTDRPILFIRDGEMGSLGFWADVSTKDIDFIIGKLKSGDYGTETLSNKIELEYKGRKYCGVNEIRLNNIIEEVCFSIYKIDNGRRTMLLPFVVSGDGMLASTKMGSTAYNMSAGGPIIFSDRVMCITLLNVDGLYPNSIVIDGDRQVEVELMKYSGNLGFDNKQVAKLSKGDSFRVMLSERRITAVKFYERDESLSEKLERRVRNRMLKKF